MPSVADKSNEAEKVRWLPASSITFALEESEPSAASNVAFLSSALWNKVFPGSQQGDGSTSSLSISAGPQVVAVSTLSSANPTRRPRGSRYTRPTLYLAQHLDAEQEQAYEDQDVVLLPSTDSISLSIPSSVRVVAHRAVQLSDVILTTSSQALLDAAQDSTSSFGNGIAGSLARQGGTISLQLGSVAVVYTEPVLQGIITAQTNIIVAYAPDADEQPGPRQGQLAIESSQTDRKSPASTASQYAIDERFLAMSVLDDFQEEEEADDIDIAHWGAAKATSPPTFIVHPCQDRRAAQEAIEMWIRRQQATTNIEVDEESIALLSESGLAGIGAFEGDWAVAELTGHTRPRLVRLFTLGSSQSQNDAYLPPCLVQNLVDEPSQYDPYSSSSPRVALLPLPSDEAVNRATPLQCPLPLPFADSVTIARVPSALSISKQYQPLFLDALRSYFEDRKRIIRKGDIIAVGVTKGKVKWAAKESENSKGGEDEAASALDISLPTLTTSQETAPDGTVHFLITDLTCELSSPVSLDSNGVVRDVDFQLRQLATTGQLGAVIDPTLTKMVQTGVANSRIIDSAGWLGSDSTLPSIPSGSTGLVAPGSPYSKIIQLLQATLLPQAVQYGLHLTVLLKGARGSGKKTIVRWIADHLGIHLIELNCFDVLGDTDTQTEGTLRARFESAASCGPAVILLQNVDALARKSQAMETGQEPAMSYVLRSCLDSLKTKGEDHRPVAVIGTTSDVDKCPNGIVAAFKHEISIEAPNETERLQILTAAVEGLDAIVSADVSLKDVATQTAALVAADLVDLVARASLASVERVKKALVSSTTSPLEITLAGTALTGSDFETALSKARSNYSESIGAPKIPNVTWDDVGGLASVKTDILDTIQLPLEHPELFADGLKKRSGILLYGPPGTGKTLLAKAVATSCSLNFFSVKGPELLNMYIGESEANVRRVFQRARDAKPCVIFFDELDSVAPKRGNQGDSGGVMDRIVSQLLAELDGMAGSKEGSDVFVIGATNRPDLLDSALLRPGRFDRMLYLSVSETHEAQLNILQALTRKFKLEEDLGDLTIIAEQCPFNLTGADFYALCSDAMLKAMTRKASQVDEKIATINASPREEDSLHPRPMTPQYYLSELATPEEIEVRVSRSDFEGALRELVPSVSEQEMEHYRRVQAQFSGPSAADTAGDAGETMSGLTIEDAPSSIQELQQQLQARAAQGDRSHQGGSLLPPLEKALPSLTTALISNDPPTSAPIEEDSENLASRQEVVDIVDDGGEKDVEEAQTVINGQAGKGKGKANGNGNRKGKGKARA